MKKRTLSEAWAAIDGLRVVVTMLQALLKKPKKKKNAKS